MTSVFDDFFNRGKPAAPADVYAAPDLKSLYAQFKEKGTVPYSYYGQGAPTNADELARVRAAYPGAFTPPPAATPATSPAQQNPLARLIQALGGGFGEIGTRAGY